MSNQIIFTETGRGDRTNIMSSFQLWSKQTFLDNIKDKKQWRNSYRYGYVDKGWVRLLKDMSLEEFETVFTSSEIDSFSPEQVTAFFRKEISEKYGEHKIKAAIKTLTAKELVKGTVYEDVNGYQYLYLGKGKLRVEQNPGYGKNELKEEKEGNVFYHVYGDKQFGDGALSGIDVLKGIKKLVKPVRTIELRQEYRHEIPKNNYRYYTTTYTLELYG